jgi:hypothetical protein
MAESNNMSQKAQENLKELKLWREESTGSGGQFVTIAAGSSKVLLFDMEDMHVQTVEFEPGKPRKRAKYAVYDISERSTEKKYLTGGKNLSLAIDSNLEEGNRVLKISRTGEKFDTKYSVVASSLPVDYKSPLAK